MKMCYKKKNIDMTIPWEVLYSYGSNSLEIESSPVLEDGVHPFVASYQDGILIVHSERVNCIFTKILRTKKVR